MFKTGFSFNIRSSGVVVDRANMLLSLLLQRQNWSFPDAVVGIRLQKDGSVLVFALGFVSPIESRLKNERSLGVGVVEIRHDGRREGRGNETIAREIRLGLENLARKSENSLIETYLG